MNKKEIQAIAREAAKSIKTEQPHKPKDKAKAEVGVQIVERWILARLCHHTFFFPHVIRYVTNILSGQGHHSSCFFGIAQKYAIVEPNINLAWSRLYSSV